MRRVKHNRNRFDQEDINPMNYLSNLSDAMLVLAVGIMLALIVHWNVDISTSGGTMSDSGISYAAEGEGGHAAVNRDDALSFSAEDLEQTQNHPQNADEGMEKLGEVYYDASTGKFYIIESEK